MNGSNTFVGKGALMVGLEYNRGPLPIGGKTVDYRSMASGSLGFKLPSLVASQLSGF